MRGVITLLVGFVLCVAAHASQDLAELEARAAEATAELAEARRQVDVLEERSARLGARQAALPGELATAREELRAAEEALTTEDATDAASERVTAARARVESLEAESASNEADRKRIPDDIERARENVAALAEVASQRTQELEERRRSDGEEAARSSLAELEESVRAFPRLEALAEETRKIAVLRTGPDGLPERIAAARERLTEDQRTLADTNRRFRSAQHRVRMGGLTYGMASTLREDFESIRRQDELDVARRERSRELSRAQLSHLELSEERFSDIDAATERWIAEQQLDRKDTELALAVRKVLEIQDEVRRAALADLDLLKQIYFDHGPVGRELREACNAYRAFIEERILWVRSSSQRPWEDALRVPADLGEIGTALANKDTDWGVESALEHEPARLALLTLWLMALLALRRVLARKRSEFARLVRSYKTDRYVYTIRAFVQTVLIALPLPLGAWIVGRVFAASSDALVHALGLAMREVAVSWLVLRVVRGMLGEKSVAGPHFRWKSQATKAVEVELRWFEPVVVVTSLVVLTLDRSHVTDWSDSIGRFTFVGWMIATAFFLHRLVREDSVIWKSGIAEGLLTRTRGAWARVSVLVPLLLAAIALLGYYYTALQFELRLRETLGFAFALLLINAFLLRWLFMTRRNLAVAHALEARARREAEEVADDDSPRESVVEPDQVDIPSMDGRTRQLFKSSLTLTGVLGLFLIWTSVLPALQMLDRVQLLPRFQVLEADAHLLSTADSGAAAATTNGASSEGRADKPESSAVSVPGANLVDTGGATISSGLPSVLTLGDVLLALVFLSLTLVAARNLPALLELALLQRLPLDAGARYAVQTIARYLIVLIGASAMSGALGIGWQKLQWLAAALTFGLAFGLQEIFANFVSGIIILIERPVRVGDVVTVGGVEGRVTQLRMRATTIQDYDRREYLIPNKDLITGHVINWSLTDPITRVVITVGVAYGSDTALARSLLIKCAKKSKYVLADPAPSAIFRRFGDSTLDFELRAFLPNRDAWPVATDDLHTSIDAAFRNAGIEIAFPQRDLHVRSVDAPLFGGGGEPEKA